MNTKLGAAAVVFALSSFTAAQAKPLSIPLKCAKSPGAVAERQYLDAASGGGNIYNVNVTFIGKKPSNAKIQATLRECLAEAIKLDGSKDMMASAWFRPHAGASEMDDDPLSPFGFLKFLSYSHATKQVVVRAAQKG